MNTQTAESSRLLDAARSINEQRKERQANAISFRTVRKEGEPLV
jgi:hypothetical protein